MGNFETRFSKNREREKELESLAVYPILLLEEFLPHSSRHKLIAGTSLILGIFSIFFLFVFLTITFSPEDQVHALSPVLSLTPRLSGLFLIIFSFWLLIYLLESFFRSIYFHNRAFKIKGPSDDPKKSTKAPMRIGEISSEVISIFYHCTDGDIIKHFFLSQLGRNIFIRAGLTVDDLSDFLEKRENILELDIADLKKAGVIDMNDFAGFLFKQYGDLSHFLFRHGINEHDFLGAALWVTREDDRVKFSERWWSRDNLAKMGSLGKDFAYGQTYRLEKYSEQLTFGSASPLSRAPHWAEEVGRMKSVLSKAKEANALLVGEGGIGLLDIVHEFAAEIDAGNVPVTIKDHRMLVVDTNLLSAAMQVKGAFEKELILLLNEAVKAGNIILVFPDFASFVMSARSIGSDVLSIMSPYLDSPQIQVVALCGTDQYHRVLAPSGEATSRFEKIFVKEPSREGIRTLLEDGALALERKFGVIFTFPAVEEILRSADYYITEGVMPDKATDLLVELAPYMAQKGRMYIKKDDVLEFVRFKTKIPVGEITKEERAVLEDLEEVLHGRVVGQDSAVSAIATSMRRARAGVRNAKKPIGTFLFLGPTGVGKTETAKALAEVFFESEERMLRFDMSEYSGPDGVERLIGSFDTGTPGTLVTMLKNFPYGVLLLDELEKASKDVHNLFLQILDEGMFSDAGGHRINARNTIMIATSNAGSDIMYEAIGKGEALTGYQGYIVDTIIKRGTFAAELINRFDAVILFHPLEKKHLYKIATLMARSLAKRLKTERGIELQVNDVLIEALVREGRDTKFGGRPMARAVKDKIEKVIAEKIIRGTIQTGSTVLLEEGDVK